MSRKSLLYRITNPYGDSENESYNPLSMGKKLIGTGLIAAPMIAAGAYASKNISSNEVGKIAGLKTNALGDASATVGNSLRNLQEFQNEVRKQGNESFKKSLMDGSYIDDILKETEQGKRAIVSGVLEAFNSLDESSEAVIGLKSRIVDIINQETINITEKEKALLTDIFSQVDQTNPTLSDKIKRSINFYKPVQNVLEAPLELTKGIAPGYKKVNITDFGGVAEGRYQRVMKALANTSFDIDTVLMNENVGRMNANALYARVTDRNTGRINMIALDLADVTRSIGSPVVRMGHGQQAFVAPIAVGNADVVQRNFLSKGVAFNAMDVSKGIARGGADNAFESFEDFQIKMLERVSEKRGGRVTFKDFGALNEDLRGMTENLNRTFTGESFVDERGVTRYSGSRMAETYTELAQRGIASKGSRIAFDLSGLDKDARRNFSANILASQVDSGIVTGHSNLQISTLNHAQIVNIAMRDGVRINIPGFQGAAGSVFEAFGLESTFKIGSQRISDVTHAVLPLTARPKQFFNLENFFVRTKGNKKFTLADKREDRALMMLDMKSHSERLGLGEGEAYLTMRGRKTLKVFPKTVLDPSGMKLPGNELLNELVMRRNKGMENLVIESGRTFQFKGKTIGIGMGQGGTGMPGIDRYFDSIGDFFRAYGNKNTGSLFLGKLDGKAIEVPFYRGISRLELGIAEKTTGTGADLLRLTGSAVLEDLNPKIFSEHLKATVKGLGSGGVNRLLTQAFKDVGFGGLKMGVGGVTGVASAIGATEGAMLKKAHYYHALQMATGAEAFAMHRGMKGDDAVTKILSRAEAIRNPTKGSFQQIKDVTKQQKLFMTSFATSVAELMASKEFQQSGATTAEEVGRVFGGFYKAFAEGGSFSSMDRAGVMGVLKGAFAGRDDAFFGKVEKEIEKGVAISLTNLRVGPDQATMRSNQASMEARLFNFLGMKLSKVGGLTADETSNFLFGIMSRKSDAGNELIAMKEYFRFHEYAKSMESVTDAQFYKGLDKVSLEKFTSMSGEEIENFLKSQKQGFLLDFGEGTAASKALNKVFKGKGSLYIPAGEAFMESLESQGTEIVKKDKVISLKSRYQNQVQYLSENLLEFTNPNQMNRDQILAAEKRVRTFQSEMSEISSVNFKALLKGKLQGSASLRSASLNIGLGNMTEEEKQSAIVGKKLAEKMKGGKYLADKMKGGVELNKAQQVRAKSMIDLVMQKRKGQTVFLETQGFLSAMSDFIEGSKKEYLQEDLANTKVSMEAKSQSALKKAKRDASLKFQSFFLGGYEDYARAHYSDMLSGVISRHPILSTGHVQMATLARYSPETMGKDKYLRNLGMFDEGQDAIVRVQKAFGADIFSEGNFEKLSKAAAMGLKNQKEKKTALRNLFGVMAENIGRFQEGEGGGRMFFTNMEMDVHYGQGNKVARVNMGLAAAAIGDFDGDNFQLILPSQKGARTINEKLLGKKNAKVFADEMLYRTGMRVLFDEAGAGIKHLSKQLGDSAVDPGSYLKGVATKEIIAKEVGQIDVALDSVRLGMATMDFNASELRHVQQAMGLLTVLEEVGTIKGKKLPKAIELGKAITHATNYAYDHGDTSKLKNLIANTIFAGQDISKGINISGMDLSGIADKETRIAVEQAVQSANGMIFDLDETMKFIERGAIHGKKMGTKYSKTARGTARTFTNERQTRALMQGFAALAEQSLQGRMTGMDDDGVMKQGVKVLSGIGDKISSMGSTFDKKMLGPGILGIAGALGVASMLASGGYAPEPMLMPGEVTDQAVGSAIAEGRLFDNRGAQTNASDYIREGNDIHGRPINTGETYVRRENSYIMNGQLPDRNAMMRVQQMMSATGASGNFVVNDTRGPISMNFINRYMED